MKVLVATDGSDAAIEAATRAFALLRREAEIVLVAVVPEYEDPEELAGGFEGPVATEEEAGRDFEEDVREGADALARTAAVLGGEAGHVEVRLVADGHEPGHAIVAVAEEIQPDLIVIGAH